ncbi:MAG: hypothetical protein HYW51_02620 [Candidatus Doudnabacteria bacterium]|nr:hypothetical protein [Candidatus Doudnabacteria bacterium]
MTGKFDRIFRGVADQGNLSGVLEALRLHDRTDLELERFLDVVTTQSTRCVAEGCTADMNRAQAFAMLASSDELIVGCRDDISLFAGFDADRPFVHAPALFLEIGKVMDARKKARNEARDKLFARYRDYLVKIRGVPKPEITNDLIEKELKEKGYLDEAGNPREKVSRTTTVTATTLRR